MPGQLYKSGAVPWERGQLTLAEQDVIDRPDPTMPGTSNEKVTAAAMYRASVAAANMANARLGLAGLDEIGVVP